MKAFALVNGNQIELPATLTLGQAADMARSQSYDTSTHTFAPVSILCDGDALPEQTAVSA